MVSYINRSDRYGEAVPVTVEDYLELNPEGVFHVWDDGIYEWVDAHHESVPQDEPGEWLRIAEATYEL